MLTYLGSRYRYLSMALFLSVSLGFFGAKCELLLKDLTLVRAKLLLHGDHMVRTPVTENPWDWVA